MKRLAALDAALTRLVETVMILLFAVFLVIVVTKVMLRPFDRAIFGVDELVKIAFLTTSALGGAVAIAKREHIAITVFVESFPPAVSMVFYVIGLVLVAAINGVLIYLSFDWIGGPGQNLWQPFGMPQSYVFIVVPVACGLAVFFCVSRILLVLSGQEELHQIGRAED